MRVLEHPSPSKHARSAYAAGRAFYLENPSVSLEDYITEAHSWGSGNAPHWKNGFNDARLARGTPHPRPTPGYMAG